MAVIALNDCKVFTGGYNLSGVSNEAHLTLNPAMLDATVFGPITKINKAGLLDFKCEVGGFMDFAFPIGAAPLPQTVSMNSALFGLINGLVDVTSIAPVGNSEGDLVYTVQQVNSQMNPMGGNVGVLCPYKLEQTAAGVTVVRGTLLGTGLKTTTGGSAAPVNIVGGVSATQKLYAALHVYGASGTTPTIDCIVRSSAVIGMTSPTTRLTFSQVTTSVSAQWRSVAGPITDAFFDVRWTIAGTSPNYLIYAVVGVA